MRRTGDAGYEEGGSSSVSAQEGSGTEDPEVLLDRALEDLTWLAGEVHRTARRIRVGLMLLLLWPPVLMLSIATPWTGVAALLNSPSGLAIAVGILGVDALLGVDQFSRLRAAKPMVVRAQEWGDRIEAVRRSRGQGTALEEGPSLEFVMGAAELVPEWVAFTWEPLVAQRTAIRALVVFWAVYNFWFILGRDLLEGEVPSIWMILVVAGMGLFFVLIARHLERLFVTRISDAKSRRRILEAQLEKVKRAMEAFLDEV